MPSFLSCLGSKTVILTPNFLSSFAALAKSTGVISVATSDVKSRAKNTPCSMLCSSLWVLTAWSKFSTSNV